MLNIEENFILTKTYNTQRDIILKIFVFPPLSLMGFQLVRGQVSEVNLLQQVPGFSFFYIFLFLVFFTFISTFLLGRFRRIELKKDIGTKNAGRAYYKTNGSLNSYFFSLMTFLNFLIVIPLGLDSFENYEEMSLISLWSYSEVAKLENFLLFILGLISQIPPLLSSLLGTESNGKLFPKYWRAIILLIVLFAGILTPTLDGYTQISFSFSTYSLYIIFLILLLKRLNIKLKKKF